MNIISKIEEKTKELGIPLFGITGIYPIPFIKKYKKVLNKISVGDLVYLKKYKERERPEILLDGLKTIIVFLFPYNFNSSEALSLKKFKIAQFALAGDYHKIIKNKLKEISKIIPGKSKIICDTSPFLEKPFGTKAGIGFIGKNTLLINKTFGSTFNLGFILTDLKLEEKKENVNGICGKCKRCIEVCPTGAIEKPYFLNPLKCISYITIEAKKIDSELKQRWGFIYGCDLCQAVCPYNKDSIYETKEEEIEIERISKERIEENKKIAEKEKIDFFIKQEKNYFPLNPSLKKELFEILNEKEQFFFYNGKIFEGLPESLNESLKRYFLKLQMINLKKPFFFYKRSN